MQKKAFVLLSGGLDSTTALYLAMQQFEPNKGVASAHITWMKQGTTSKIQGQYAPKEYPWVEAVSIDYGQRHLKETEYAKRTCDRLGINHTTLNVGALLSGVSVMLTSKDIKVPDVTYSEIKGVSPTYVPFRNGLMLSAIAAHAQKYVNIETQACVERLNSRAPSPEKPTYGAMGIDLAQEEALYQSKDLCGVYFAAHADDALNWAYPDCTPEFIGAMTNAIYIGTYNTVRLFAPFASLSKGQIVEWGGRLGVPYENTWSCYKGEELHCGVCPTCRSRKDAFKEAGVNDPTEYAQ